MSEIFRIRPANSFLIEELEESYLWFSRPSEFNDTEDSNVFSFIEKNETIKSSFIRLFSNYNEIVTLASTIGVCCFTNSLPEKQLWKKFPKGYNGVLIKYDKSIIEKQFQINFGLPDCFKKVEYFPVPTLFKKYSEHDILWEITKNGELYKSLIDIEKDEKLRDELFLKIFTRIKDKYSYQNEYRIILSGNNIPNKSSEIDGYKVSIPKTATLAIYIHPNTPDPILNKINSLDFKIINTI